MAGPGAPVRWWSGSAAEVVAVLASFRAELFVLRKWRVAWALVAAVPVYVIILYDLGSYVQYLTVSPLGSQLVDQFAEQ